MVLKEKEFCEFVTCALEKSLPKRGSTAEFDESQFPRVTIMQLTAGKGFWISADVGSVRASLGSVRNETRRFASIDSAAAFVRKLGVVSFRVVNLGYDATE